MTADEIFLFEEIYVRVGRARSVQAVWASAVVVALGLVLLCEFQSGRGFAGLVGRDVARGEGTQTGISEGMAAGIDIGIIAELVALIEESFESRKVVAKNHVAVETVVPDSDARTPIFMYHEVRDRPWGLEGLFIRVNDFEAQMKYLSDNGFQTLFVNEISRQRDFRGKVVLTFDDGYVGFYENVLPVLKMYNLKASLYVMSSVPGGLLYVSVEQLKEIRDSGLVEIGCHTRTHPDLTTLSLAGMEAEIVEAKAELEAMLGIEITSFAYPSGAYNSAVVGVVKQHYKNALITSNAVADIAVETDYYVLPRLSMYRGTPFRTFVEWCLLGR